MCSTTRNGQSKDGRRLSNGQVRAVAGFTKGGDIRLKGGATLGKAFSLRNARALLAGGAAGGEHSLSMAVKVLGRFAKRAGVAEALAEVEARRPVRTRQDADRVVAAFLEAPPLG